LGFFIYSGLLPAFSSVALHISYAEHTVVESHCFGTD